MISQKLEAPGLSRFYVNAGRERGREVEREEQREGGRRQKVRRTASSPLSLFYFVLRQSLAMQPKLASDSIILSQPLKCQDYKHVPPHLDTGTLSAAEESGKKKDSPLLFSSGIGCVVLEDHHFMMCSLE